jgi:phosphatidylserine/phosphatidylglycerophosphate/cardiolipin synthase-like enzyme
VACERGSEIGSRLIALSFVIALAGCGTTRGEPALADLTGGIQPVALGITGAAQDDRGLLLTFAAVVDEELAPTPLQLTTLDDGVVAGLSTIAADDWRQRWPEAAPLPVLSPMHWRRAQEEILEALMEGVERDALIVRLGDVEEAVVLRDEEGGLLFLPLAERPDDVAISGALGAGEVSRRSLAAVEAFLAEQGISDRQVVFDTGDPTPGLPPSLFVDLDEGLLQMHRFGSGAPEGAGRSMARAADATSTVVVEGTVVEILTRPISTLHRLVFSVKHAVTDLARPTDSRRVMTLRGDPPPLARGPGMDMPAFEQRLDEVTGTRASEGRIDVLVGGDAYFPRLAQSLAAADESVDLQMFIFKTDDVAVGVADQLRALSASRDVKVLLDGVGTSMGVVPWKPGMPPDFVPPTSIVRHLRHDSDVATRTRTAILLRADHTKLILVDDDQAFLGGMNIGREYRYDWHDLMFEVEGPVLAELSAEFDDHWAMAGWAGDLGYLFHLLFRSRQEPPTAPEGSVPLRVLRTRSGRSEVYQALMEAARSARRRILVQNAYFADDALITELVAARGRGVDVQVILPLEGNHGVMNANTVVTANVLLSHGVAVHLYPDMSHVKAAIFDDWALVGSANFDRLSLRRNQELSLASSAPSFVEELLREVFEPDLAASHTMSEPFDVTWSDRVGAILAGML